ncbi:MAG: N-6 DNA methylase [Acidobacteriia bacterium]|nr:N-6 DNA methylase [Terriglobia bacterium]
MPGRRPEPERVLNSEAHLISAAFALGATSVKTLSPAEEKLCRKQILSYDAATRDWIEQYIKKGNDPLGDAFSRLRSPELRRPKGATYTPATIVLAMVRWARGRKEVPLRIVDPGMGSGRFLLAAGNAFPNAELIGVDVDPLATLLARANLNAMGFAERASIHLGDYRSLKLPPIDGKTLYIGNPPYVRHHLIEPSWKQWLTEGAQRRGFRVSQLAGLHVHFFLATVLQAKAGDFGSFITAAEWLDVNYGSLVRELFLSELGGQSIAVIEPAASPFADAETTAVISTFEIGSQPTGIRVKRVSGIGAIEPLDSGRLLHRSRFETQSRWSHLTRRAKDIPSGYVELGELCRVHRGQVTGANRVWISGEHSAGLPISVLFRSITKARELFGAGTILADSSGLKQVIDLPRDLSVFEAEDRRAVDQFLRRAKQAGADKGYVAENRKTWWSVGLRQPAPILATYMARRPPAFVRNRADARHINIAHGLYPRESLNEEVLLSLVKYLNTGTSVVDGRTYAGGLTKFEPREMERIAVPTPAVLLQQ